MNYVGLLILSLIITFGVLGFYFLAKDSDRIHNQLRQFRSQAEILLTREELFTLKESLKVFAAKECWHHHYTSHAQNVLDFINGRLHSLPHEPNR